MKFVEMLNDTADNFKGKINPIVETAIDTLDKMKENGEDIVEDVRFQIGEAVSRVRTLSNTVNSHQSQRV